jgi:putative membrane protein
MAHYLAIKVIHVVAVIAWMAGLFYLPRLFVYHTTYPENGAMLQIMEAKLYRIIMNPAMMISVVSGLILIFAGGFERDGWMHAKFTCVIFLIMFQFALNSWRKQLSIGSCSKSPKFFRLINEIPTLVLILIVVLVIIKPF